MKYSELTNTINKHYREPLEELKEILKAKTEGPNIRSYDKETLKAPEIKKRCNKLSTRIQTETPEIDVKDFITDQINGNNGPEKKDRLINLIHSHKTQTESFLSFILTVYDPENWQRPTYLKDFENTLKSYKQKKESENEAMQKLWFSGWFMAFNHLIAHQKALLNHILNSEEQPTEKTDTQKDEKEEAKELPFYVKIGALFAQGHIKRSKSYFYLTTKKTDPETKEETEKETKFDSVSDLARAVQGILGTKKKEVRSYINDTLNNQGIKNFYDSKGMMKKINLYCEENGIKTTPEFKERFERITF